MAEPYLKPYQYYSDLYDRHTVEQCRRTERLLSETDNNPPKSKKLTKEQEARAIRWAGNMLLRFEAGERYLNKDKTIREWMDRDKQKDQLLESAQAPEDIRCLTCRNRTSPTFKQLWSELDKPDRVLFMYDCPNRCLPHRAFFSDGEEWRAKPRLCPQCHAILDEKVEDSNEKLITTRTCPQCTYTKTEEYEWKYKKEEEIDVDFAKDRDRFCLTDEEGRNYQDEKYALERLGKIGEELKEREKERAEKLEANPRGFHLEGAGYTCFICGNHTREGDNWYDKWGIKCLVCQMAIDKREIPASLAKDKESWYSKYDLERAFNLKSATLRKWIKDGTIKARTVSNHGKGVHTQLFLIKDNRDLLPPKKLVESHGVHETKEDGSTWLRLEPWYRLADPHEHLKGYRILEYLEIIEAKEEAAETS